MTLRRVLFFICVLAAASASGSSGSFASGSRAIVQRVVDGATIEVRYQGRVQTVGLLGIRAPRRGQCGYAGSSKSLRTMLTAGQVVRLRRDAKHGGARRYVSGRNRDAGMQQVSHGWAAVAATASFARRGAYARAQGTARGAHRGGWRACKNFLGLELGAPPPQSPRVIGYFASWSVYGRNYHVADIPAGLLTNVNYAFANVSDGWCVLGDPWADADQPYPGDSTDPGALHGSFHQLQLLKQSHSDLRTLISVGGWTWSGSFSDVALTQSSREKFAASCVQFMKQYGFDGIDIDWEFPVSGGLQDGRPADKHNYTLLLAELRSRLDALGSTNGRHYLLTIAAPAGPDVYPNLELSKVSEQLDWINLMAYDFNGGWSAVTNFNAPLHASTSDPSPTNIRTKFNDDAAVQAYRAAGVPAAKIVLGVPFYGRAFKGVPNANGGLYQAFDGVPQGTWNDGSGMYDFWDIEQHFLSTYTRHWQAEAKVPWLFNPATGIMISYDDPESLQAKAGYAKAKDLGGVMIWELSQDDASNKLVHALADGLARVR
jgi:GH18 family chitinase/endonuclease YncB( thermonuclease family)